VCLFSVLAYAQDQPHSAGWIAIPANEYAALHAKAFPAGHEPDRPAADATLTRVDYDLRVAGDSAGGHAALTIDVLKDGWVRVPIPSGLFVREATLEGKPVALVPAAGSKGQMAAVLSQRGRAVIQLDVAFPVASTSGEEKLSLPPSSSGVTRASITMPRQDLELKVTGGYLSKQTGDVWLAYGHGNDPLVLTWRRKMEENRAALPLRTRGSLVQLLGLGEDSTSVYADVNLDVVQGAARQAKIQVPPSIAINQVLGANVADWELKNGELAVSFLEPVDRNARFVVSGETRLARDGQLQIPVLRLLDTERETGGIAVEVVGAGEIVDLQSRGFDRADASDLGSIVAGRQSPSLVAFRLKNGGPAAADRSLQVKVARYEQQAVLTANVEEARYRVLAASDGKLLVEARYAFRNNQRSFVKITLPQSAVVWGAYLADKPVRPGQAPDGGLLIPLEKSQAGEEAAPFALEVLYLVRTPEWSEKGRATVALPSLDVPVSRTGLSLYYSPLFHVTAQPGAFRSKPYEAPFSPALIASAAPASIANARPASLVQAVNSDLLNQFQSNAAQASTQSLVEKFRARNESRDTGRGAPGRIPFPSVGPSIYLVSELTSENQAASLELAYQKGGSK
jgi:hypothetical protein